MTKKLLTSRACAMRLKHILCDIQTNHRNLTHSRLLKLVLNNTYLGTSMPSGGVHPIIITVKRITSGDELK